MCSGLTLLYILYLRKQFGTESDGITVVFLRSLLHVFSAGFLLFSGLAGVLDGPALASTYIFVVATNRGSAYILTRGLRMRRRNNCDVRLSYRLSLLFSIVEVFPALFFLLTYLAIFNQGLPFVSASLILSGFWLWLLGAQALRLGSRSKVFKQHFGLCLHLALPMQLYISTISGPIAALTQYPVGLASSVIFSCGILLFSKAETANDHSNNLAINTQDDVTPGLSGINRLLRPKKTGISMCSEAYRHELIKYLDSRIVGFPMLKTLYIKNFLRHLCPHQKL